MKKGRDEEKIMGPMFPRLHVNDAGKGGPRAPPRNKMALYEQLSIPSQRFNPINTATSVPPSSLSQGSGRESSMFFPIHSSCTTRPDPAEVSYSGFSDSNTSLAPVLQKKKLNEDDFMVPVLVQSELGHDHSKNSNGMDMEKFSPSGWSYLACSVEVQNTSNREPKQTSIMGSNLRQEGRSQNKENPKELMAVDQQSIKSVKSLSASEKTRGPSKQFSAPVDLECSGHLASTGASLDHDSRARSQLHNSMCGNDVSYEPVRSIKNGRAFIPTRDSSREKLGCPDNPTFDSEYHEARTHGSMQIGNGDGGDDASETSMVDSIPEFDISPDDVVGMIGQKHFWKARRAIVNQQRVFAVQVFELHRLIKVQRLIAGSPHLLLEDGAYLGKPLKGSLANKLPLELIIKPSTRIVKCKDNSENNPIHKMECSAENAVGKTSLSSVQNSSQPSNHRPFPGNPLSPSVVTETEMSSPWCFPQLAGHQWLIPVMSPSEGLIYKPCPGHGFVGSVCGSFGPPGLNPAMGSSINPAYGGPPHYSYQGIGITPASPLVGYGYFPPHGTPVYPAVSGSAVEQPNCFSGIGSDGQSGQLSGGEDNFNTCHRSSGNAPTTRNGVISNVVQPRASKASDLRGSTASSRGEKAERIGMGQPKKGGNAFRLFPASADDRVPGVPRIDEADQRTMLIKVVPHNARSAAADTEQRTKVIKVVPHNARSAADDTEQRTKVIKVVPHNARSAADDTEQRTKVIKVVPHNARSATESAARIFRSIQEERIVHDSV